MGAPAPLSSADTERLRYAAGAAVDPAHSLLGSGSLTWRVNREAVLLLGGGRALLMQVAHPLVAAGVAAHSRFRDQPLQRLQRTLDLTLTITFGDARAALAAVRRIERVHAAVRGTLSAAVGPFRRGRRYAAGDPRLLFWVHATLVDSALRTYERFVQPLSPAARRRYYAESKIVARLFGVPERLIPPMWLAFERYMRDMLDGDVLAVGPAGRAIADSILDPPMPIGLRQVVSATGFFTAGLLPPALRTRYGLEWNAGREQVLAASAAAIRAALPLLPALLRYFPHARRSADGARVASGRQS